MVFKRIRLHNPLSLGVWGGNCEGRCSVLEAELGQDSLAAHNLSLSVSLLG